MKKDDFMKFNISEKWKDKKEKAKIELLLYGIFFLIIIVFARVTNSLNSNNNSVKVDSDNVFIDLIKDNYKYNIDININDQVYNFNGKVLGYNSTFVRKINGKEEHFYKMNDKYYMLDNDGNYLLSSKEDIYSIIDFNYLDVNTIKEYVRISNKENNIYLVKISDVILGSNSDDNIVINLNENEKKINIDYTNLLKIKDSTVEKCIVDITYSDIDNIITLD